MTAQLWKRGDEEPRVTFRCPWCDVVGVSGVYGHYEQRKAIWLLVACPDVPCGRGVLVRVPTRSGWAMLDTGADGLLLDDRCVMPVTMAKGDTRRLA
ncbi:MAG: hypothetical protein ACM31C_02915 [Acidobacteriota bacterium]